MTTADLRTTFEWASAGYDAEFEQGLVDAILQAIAGASKVTDVDTAVVPTGETTSALLTCLAIVLAMSPSATRSPSALRQTLDVLGKRLRGRLAAAEHSPGMRDFVRRAFHGTGTDGMA
jgi:hypothetical protein